LYCEIKNMSTIAADLDEALSHLDPNTANLLERTVRDALALAEHRANDGPAGTDNRGYPAGYFESTAGSFADEPLERPANLPLPAREQW
jgi:hypothetical protein